MPSLIPDSALPRSPVHAASMVLVEVYVNGDDTGGLGPLVPRVLRRIDPDADIPDGHLDVGEGQDPAVVGFLNLARLVHTHLVENGPLTLRQAWRRAAAAGVTDPTGRPELFAAAARAATDKPGPDVALLAAQPAPAQPATETVAAILRLPA